MRVVLQRVTQAAVTVGERTLGAIGRGLVLLVGFAQGDTQATVNQMVERILTLRMFGDATGKMTRSAREVEAACLAIPEITLVADLADGRRPNFAPALPPVEASRLFDHLVNTLKQSGLPVAHGAFQAHMAVSLVNDGPVTFILELHA